MFCARMTRCLCLPLLLATVACRTEPARQSPPDAVASWATGTVSDTGFGPIVVGMTSLEAKAASGDRLQLPERLDAAGCDYASDPGLEGLTFMIENGRVVRVDVRTRGIRTAEGAAVGDTEARIQELYAGRVTVSPHKYTDGHYLTVDGSRRRSRRGATHLRDRWSRRHSLSRRSAATSGLCRGMRVTD